MSFNSLKLASKTIDNDCMLFSLFFIFCIFVVFNFLEKVFALHEIITFPTIGRGERQSQQNANKSLGSLEQTATINSDHFKLNVIEHRSF